MRLTGATERFERFCICGEPLADTKVFDTIARRDFQRRLQVYGHLVDESQEIRSVVAPFIDQRARVDLMNGHCHLVPVRRSIDHSRDDELGVIGLGQLALECERDVAQVLETGFL